MSDQLRPEWFATIDDTVTLLNGMGRYGIVTRLVRLRKGLAALHVTDTLDVERLARAMHPVWFEPTPATKPDTLTNHEWGQMLLNVTIRRADALREAAVILARLTEADHE